MSSSVARLKCQSGDGNEFNCRQTRRGTQWPGPDPSSAPTSTGSTDGTQGPSLRDDSPLVEPGQSPTVRVGGLLTNPHGHLGAAGETELGQDVLNVSLRGTPRDHQPVGNLFVAEPFTDQPGDLTLSTRQQVLRRGRGLRGVAPGRHFLQCERDRARLIERTSA